MNRETELRIVLAAAIAVAIFLGWNLARIDGAWEREAIERGYGDLCFDGRRFAWKGECL